MIDIVERLREKYYDTKKMLPNSLCHEAADEIENLRQQLAECQAWSDAGYKALELQTKSLAESQAREAKLLDDIDRRLECAGITIYSGRPQRDDTALKEAIKQAKREALLEAAEAVVNDAQRIGSDWVSGHHADTLRRMAEELK